MHAIVNDIINIHVPSVDSAFSLKSVAGYPISFIAFLRTSLMGVAQPSFTVRGPPLPRYPVLIG